MVDLAAYVSRDGNGGTLSFLGEGDNTSDGRVTLEYSYSLFIGHRRGRRGREGNRIQIALSRRENMISN